MTAPSQKFEGDRRRTAAARSCRVGRAFALARRTAPAWPLALGMALAACARSPSTLDLPRIAPAERAAELAAAAQVAEATAAADAAGPPSPATAAATEAADATAVALGAAATEGQDFLVWQRHAGKAVTWWVHLQPGQSRVEAEREGLWLAGRDDIYGWRVKRRRVRACDPAACAEADGACESVLVGGGPFQGRIDDVELVGLLAPRPRPLGPRLPDSAALDLGTPGLQRSIAPTAQLGPLLVVEVVTETLSCGPMHGESTREPRLAVIPDGVLLPVVDAATEAELLAGIGEAQVGLLRREHPAADGALRWLTLHQRREASGRWTLLQEFGRDERGADGRAELRSLRVPLSALPAAWQTLAQQAPALREVAAALPPPPGDAGEVHAGWSRLELERPRREELRRRFAQSSKPP